MMRASAGSRTGEAGAGFLRGLEKPRREIIRKKGAVARQAQQRGKTFFRRIVEASQHAGQRPGVAGQGVGEQRQAEGDERGLSFRRRVMKIDRDGLALRLRGENRPVDQARAAQTPASACWTRPCDG